MKKLPLLLALVFINVIIDIKQGIDYVEAQISDPTLHDRMARRASSILDEVVDLQHR